MKQVVDMEFVNLDCNILYLLNRWSNRPNGIGYSNVEQIYREFSDIPSDDVMHAIIALENDGLLEFDDEAGTLMVTPEGIRSAESAIGCPTE